MTALLKYLLTPLLLFPLICRADVQLPNVFSDHMVLQVGQNNPIWGKASPGEKITVSIAGQSHLTTADDDGHWRVTLSEIATGRPQQLSVMGNNKLVINDVLIGEVWLCSGQSNMEWSVDKSKDSQLEKVSANYPNMRILKAPRRGSEAAEFDFEDRWQQVSPTSIGEFSAACYFYGRQLHNTLGLPVGLIQAAWGGARIEAFMPRNAIEQTHKYTKFLQDWDRRISQDADREFQQKMTNYQQWLNQGAKGFKYKPVHPRIANHAPGSIYNGLIHPVVGYGIKGAIWYQGESNVDRAYQYRSLFPLLINTWRRLWQQGDFPFYWVQLANYKKSVTSPSISNPWAELREAQSMTLSLPNTSEVIAIDLGESKDIHPRDKQTVAKRLARHALNKSYEFNIPSDSPRFASVSFVEKLRQQGDSAHSAQPVQKVAVLTFDKVSTHLYAFDVKAVQGFAIAGEDKKFVWAEAKIINDHQVEVYADSVPNPAAVRYGFEANPNVNLYDFSGLPVAPFRTDDWPTLTRGKETVSKL